MKMFGRKRDPLINALLKKLPPPGAYWSKEDREHWMLMLSLSLQSAYADKPLRVVESVYGTGAFEVKK